MLENEKYIGMPLRERIIQGGLGFVVFSSGVFYGAGIVDQTLDLLANDDLGPLLSGMIGLASLGSLYVAGTGAYEIVHAIKGEYFSSYYLPRHIPLNQRSFIDDGK